jgi:DNA-binding XRE family transcriptional regulator
MSGQGRWRDSGHLERAIETAGGSAEFEAEVEHLQDQARGWRLAEMRKRQGHTQEQVAAHMGVSVARVSQVEKGNVSTRDVLGRYVTALPVPARPGLVWQAARTPRRRCPTSRSWAGRADRPGLAPPEHRQPSP